MNVVMVSAVVFAVSLTIAGPGASFASLAGEAPILEDPGDDPFALAQARWVGLEHAPDVSLAQMEILADQRVQLALASTIRDQLGDVEEGDADAALRLTRLALENRELLVEDRDDERVLEGLSQQHRNLDLTSRVLEGSDAAGLDGVVFLVYQASLWQADTFEWERPSPPAAVPATLSVTEAVQTLVQRHGMEIPRVQQEKLKDLYRLPEEVTETLAAALEAFLVLEDETQQAFAEADMEVLPEFDVEQMQDRLDAMEADPDRLRHGESGSGSWSDPAKRMQQARLDLSGVLDARLALLATVRVLDDALERTESQVLEASRLVDVPGVLAISVGDEDDVYEEDYRFQLDTGGHDEYRNNAGGSNVEGDCSEPSAGSTAVLVDLDGDDRFGADRRGCGANGGGFMGTGLIVASGGDDEFVAGGAATNGGALDGVGLIVSPTGNGRFDAFSFGTNGGATGGAGAIVTLTGDDFYDGGSLGSNGAGAEAGVGAIIDLQGDDEYEAGIIGSNGSGDGYLLGGGVGLIIDTQGTNLYHSRGGNGGGARGGVGFLFDGSGDAEFFTHGFGANGGGSNEGVGMLVDTGGANRFEAAYVGVNGGASSNAVGFLVNLGRASAYTAYIEGDPQTEGGFQGVNGGSTDGGIGFLLNRAGGSGFEGRGWGVNGGAADGGVSLLISGDGDDTFLGRSTAINGGAVNGAALLVNLGGMNHYEAGSGGTNGGGQGDGVGAVIDLGGDDTYLSDGRAANGGSRNGGIGLLLDVTGDDHYEADGSSANGGADALSYALLSDGEGTDRYLDRDTDCWDCTVVPKGAIGAQVDHGPVT